MTECHLRELRNAGSCWGCALGAWLTEPLHDGCLGSHNHGRRECCSYDEGVMKNFSCLMLICRGWYETSWWELRALCRGNDVRFLSRVTMRSSRFVYETALGHACYLLCVELLDQCCLS